ncbi:MULTISPECIES: hypothetical protein [Pseudoalteromonas]|nr:MULTISPECIES: hypothetical protein [Pseudoalteromonas]WRU73566.1 hypothetical protein VOI46_02385 [Pseudoalteromonas sp. CuT 4-3]
MLTQEIETSTLLYQRASKQGAYKKFKHRVIFGVDVELAHAIN